VEARLSRCRSNCNLSGLFFAAVAKTGVAVGTVVGIGSAPIIAGLIGFFFLGQRPGRRWGGATFLAIIGCSLLALSSSQTDVQINPIGLLLALVADRYAPTPLPSKNFSKYILLMQ